MHPSGSSFRKLEAKQKEDKAKTAILVVGCGVLPAPMHAWLRCAPCCVPATSNLELKILRDKTQVISTNPRGTCKNSGRITMHSGCDG